MVVVYYSTTDADNNDEGSHHQNTPSHIYLRYTLIVTYSIQEINDSSISLIITKIYMYPETEGYCQPSNLDDSQDTHTKQIFVYFVFFFPLVAPSSKNSPAPSIKIWPPTSGRIMGLDVRPSSEGKGSTPPTGAITCTTKQKKSRESIIIAVSFRALGSKRKAAAKQRAHKTRFLKASI